MQVDVLNTKGEKTGRTVELPDDIFAIEPNDHAIYLAVKQYLAQGRQGTHKVKTRVPAASCTSKKVPVDPVKEISVIHYTKVVVPFSVRNPMTMDLN
jgi:hypothetical protein